MAALVLTERLFISWKGAVKRIAGTNLKWLPGDEAQDSNAHRVLSRFAAGGTGLFSALETVTRSQFQAYVAA
jgi:hypothetical protein